MTELLVKLSHEFVNYFVFVVIMQFAIVLSKLLDSFAVRLEETDFFAVFESKAYTVSLAGCRIEDCNVRNLNSSFFFNDATWLVQGRNRLLMFLNQVDTFNDEFAGRQNIFYFTAFTFIFTG